MSVVFVHRKRLSCAVEAASTVVDDTYYPLVLPSNAFSAPPLYWFSMGRVDVMVVRGVWETWGAVLLSLGIGIAAFAFAVGFAVYGAPSPHECRATCNHWLNAAYNFVCFTSLPGIEQLQVEAGRILAVWSSFAVVMLMPQYLSASNWYECGEVRLNLPMME